MAKRVEHRRVVRGKCWEVDIDKGKTYPQIKIDGKKVAVHRAYYEAIVGPIPPGLHVLHECDNPRCHRPSHLWVGTSTDNVRDMLRKGRNRGRAPFVCDGLVKALAAVLSQTEVAECFGVSQHTISCALRRAGVARGRSTSFGKAHGLGGRKNHDRTRRSIVVGALTK